ncbi:MAG: hypothetical protein ACK5WA_01360, partial [Alphaproteobacteria bacterium]
TVTFQNDSNLTCSSVFSYQGNYMWVTLTTSTMTKSTLSQDSSAGPVIMHAGSTVTEQIMGNLVVVTFTGKITDSGSTADLNNIQIGNFAQSPPSGG